MSVGPRVVTGFENNHHGSIGSSVISNDNATTVLRGNALSEGEYIDPHSSIRRKEESIAEATGN